MWLTTTAFQFRALDAGCCVLPAVCCLLCTWRVACHTGAQRTQAHSESRSRTDVRACFISYCLSCSRPDARAYAAYLCARHGRCAIGCPFAAEHSQYVRSTHRTLTRDHLNLRFRLSRCVLLAHAWLQERLFPELARACAAAFTRGCVACTLANGLRARHALRVLTCCDVVRGPRVGAGKLVWGALGSNECPAGSYRITVEAQCQGASAIAARPWGGSRSMENYQMGCQWYTGNLEVWFNTHYGHDEAGYSTELLCAVGTGPPRPLPRRDAHHMRASIQALTCQQPRALAHVTLALTRASMRESTRFRLGFQIEIGFA